LTYELINIEAIDKAETLLNKYLVEPKYFEHFDAKTIDEAISLLDEVGDEAVVIAGGVDLVSLMRNKLVRPKVLVNIKTIPGMSYITEDAEGLKIGTLTTISEIAESMTVQNKYGILADAAHMIATWQIRNMATVGGDLCQSVRCWYYRRSPLTGARFFCKRKGGEVCYAIEGDNRCHAIIANRECASVCPSDMASALTALRAKVMIAGPDGEKLVPLEEFYTVMGNILKPNEIITEIQCPTPTVGTKQRFLKFRLRKAIDFALSSVAATMCTKDGVVSDVRIILGGVSAIPYRAVLAEEVLKGELVTDDVAEKAAEAAVIGATPLKMNAYKVPITRSLVKRVILQLSEGSPSSRY